MKPEACAVGIIGGSGLYAIDGLEKTGEKAVATPFGRPSDKYFLGRLAGHDVVFLPRHARGHKILPSEINHRATIYGFKKLGVRWVLSVSAVGSLKEEYRPQDIVLVDQYFDRTRRGKVDTFFGDGAVAHVSFGDPVCARLARIIAEAAATAAPAVRVHARGTYVNMEGPAFSTRAESNAYRQQGFDVIGMTNLFEAKLAREAELCYATMAMVTDYDCWHEGHANVTVDMVVENLRRNAENAKAILKEAVRRIPECPEIQDCRCAHALEHALLTDKKSIPPRTKKKISLLLKKYL